MNSSDIHIPGYSIHSAIGHGGMASVYLATQESLNRKVAIKVLRNRAEEDVGERFVNEARFIASLNNPHVITIHDISTLANGDCYIAMEFTSGGDVTDNLERLSEPKTILDLIRQVALGLSAVHENGIIHRDVKPANILFRKDGTAVLTDFGVAKDVDNNSDLTQAGSSLGSPSYSSPEQAQGQPLDLTTDIYSLGVVLLELLLGHNPFKGDSHTSTAFNHLQMPVPALPDDLDYLSPLVKRMLAKNPGQRHRTCAELIADLDRIMESQDAGRGLEKETAYPARLNRNWRTALTTRLKPALAGLASCAILAAVYFVVFYQSETERQVNRLLGQAEQSMAEGHYIAPENDNARHYYRQVLLLDRTNLEAILGLKTAEQRQVDAYLAQGAQALERGRLQRPQGDNALGYFRQALAIDADNRRARAGIAQVIDAYVRLVRADMRERNYERAQDHVVSGLKIAPGNEWLLALKTELKQKQTQKQKQKRKQQTPPARTYFRKLLDKIRDKLTGNR